MNKQFPIYNVFRAYGGNQEVIYKLVFVYSVGGVVGRGGGPAAAAAAAAALPHARQRLTMGDRCACATSRAPQGRRQLLVSWTQATSRRPSVYHYHTTNVLN